MTVLKVDYRFVGLVKLSIFCISIILTTTLIIIIIIITILFSDFFFSIFMQLDLSNFLPMVRFSCSQFFSRKLFFF